MKILLTATVLAFPVMGNLTPHPAMPCAMMIVEHEVSDFADWKKVFDGSYETRKSVGELSYRIMRSELRPSNVTVIFEWDRLDRARAFAAEPILANGMRAAGVISEPRFRFLRCTDDKK